MTGRELYELTCEMHKLDPLWEAITESEKLLWGLVAGLAHQQSAVHGGLWSGMMMARKGKKGVKKG